MLGAGIALGPIVSSALAAEAGWRSWYWLTVLAAGLLSTAAAAMLPDSRAQQRRRLDVPGALTMPAGVSALMTAVTLGRSGWAQPAVLVLSGLAAVLLAAFYRIEARRRDP